MLSGAVGRLTRIGFARYQIAAESKVSTVEQMFVNPPTDKLRCGLSRVYDTPKVYGIINLDSSTGNDYAAIAPEIPCEKDVRGSPLTCQSRGRH